MKEETKMERSRCIFGNEIAPKDYAKAVNTQKKFIRKFGDDRNRNYFLDLEDIEVLTPVMNAKKIIIAKNPDGTKQNGFICKVSAKSMIIGNIRMGFGHYRISMAMASAAASMGYTPLWMDLNSFPETTCTKIISYQNDLYSMGSRLSQKNAMFNKMVWEPMNYEGFKKLSYNASDQKTAELMTSIFKGIPQKLPFIATHVWPAQAAIHAGMENVVNAIPDNWPMALHLSEGALHTVQTPNAYWGYRNLYGFDGDKILNPMEAGDILMTGHYIDHEIVKNIETDCQKRLSRIKNKKPLRFLLTIGGAGAQGEYFAEIIKTLLPYIKGNKAALYINCGDYSNVWEKMKKTVPELASEKVTTYFDDWNASSGFAKKAIGGKDPESGSGIHVFCHKDIFAAVYITNLLMRASDILVTKPSELAFYPVPKLFIRRIGGHEMWGAIRSADLGDGTHECESAAYAAFVAKQIINNPELGKMLIDGILTACKKGIYDGAYNAVKAAAAMTRKRSAK